MRNQIDHMFQVAGTPHNDGEHWIEEPLEKQATPVAFNYYILKVLSKDQSSDSGV